MVAKVRADGRIRKGGRLLKPDGPLTVEQRNAVLAAWLAEYPTPIAFILSRFPGLVRRAVKLGFDHDDINAAALLGGVEAARLFDPRVGVKFTSFAGFRIRQQVQRLLYHAERDAGLRGTRHLGSLDYALSDDSGDTLGGALAATDEGVERTGVRAELAAGVAALIRTHLPCPRQRQVVVLRWGLDGKGCRTLTEVAGVFGVTRERIRQIERKVRERIGPELFALYREHCSPF